jgi:DNA-binding LytR/AlgR family response regulator
MKPEDWSMGRNSFAVGAVLWSGYVAITSVVGALSALADRARAGAPVDAWEPFVWEFSSGLLWLLLIPAIAALERRFPFTLESWPRVIWLHVAATVPVSAIHVAGMVGLREAAYLAAGGNYDFGDVPSEFLYEWRKDALSYFFVIAVLHAYRWARAKNAGEAVIERTSTPDQVRFEVRTRGRRLSIAAGDVDWIEAAGNYVVLHTGGSEHMLRSTLKAVLAALGSDRFVRVHRSAAVNIDRVVEIDERARVAKTAGGGAAPVARTYWSDLTARFSARNTAPVNP